MNLSAAATIMAASSSILLLPATALASKGGKVTPPNKTSKSSKNTAKAIKMFQASSVSLSYGGDSMSFDPTERLPITTASVQFEESASSTQTSDPQCSK